VRLVVVGHPDVLLRAAKLVGNNIELASLTSPDRIGSADANSRAMPIFNVCGDDAAAAPGGAVDARAGEAA
jgi:hypothetical protein